MKKWIVAGSFLCTMLSLSSCKKDSTTDQTDLVPIIYEAETSAAGLELKINEYFKRDTAEGVELKDWIINGKGVFDTTVYIKKGLPAEIRAYHPTSTDWKIKIRKKDGSIIAQTDPEQSISGSGYSGTATIVVDE